MRDLGRLRQPSPRVVAPLFALPFGLAVQRDLVAIPTAGGGARVLDGRTGHDWPVGQPGDAPAIVSLVHDASAIYERRGDEVGVWPIDVPQSPWETLLAATHLTNATLDADGTLRY